MADSAKSGDPLKIEVRKQDGSRAKSLTLKNEIFGIQPNVAVLHQVVTAQLAGARSGTQSTKTRSEVRGGGSKPWRQKGTGRARAGSLRAPNFSGGGVSHAPKPRSYKQKTPKKMIQLALKSALSDRASEGRIFVVDEWTFSEPKTKDALAVLEGLGVDGKLLIVLDREDENAYLSFRNLPDVQVMLSAELNAYDVLCSDWIIFTEDTLPEEPRRQNSQLQEIPADIALKPRTQRASAAPATEPTDEASDSEASDAEAVSDES